jgi:multidrug efflux system membrane fusion protein
VAVQRDVPIEISRIGTVEAFSSVGVKSLVAGEIIRVHFTEGQDVNQGDLLFEIDSRPYEQTLRQAEAALAKDVAQQQQAEASLARNTGQQKHAETVANRYEQLRSEGVFSKAQTEDMQSASQALKEAMRGDLAAIESAKASASSDKAWIDKAKLDLSYCAIRAPISGRTGSMLVKQGNLVKSNDIPVVTINQVTPIRVNFTVPQQDLPPIRAALSKRSPTVSVKIPNDPGGPEQGTLTFIDNAVDATTGTIQLKATLPNTNRRLWPGLFVEAKLTVGIDAGAIVIPAEAVQNGQAGRFVFVVKADQTVEVRPVEVKRMLGGEAIVSGSVHAGETVVTDGQLRVRPGSKVRVMNPSAVK